MLLPLILTIGLPSHPSRAVPYRFAAIGTSGIVYTFQRGQSGEDARPLKIGRGFPLGVTLEHAALGPDGRTLVVLVEKRGRRSLISLSPISSKGIRHVRSTVAAGRFLCAIPQRNELIAVGSTAVTRHSLSTAGFLGKGITRNTIGGDTSDDVSGVVSPDGRTLYILSTTSGQDWSTGRVIAIPASGREKGQPQALPVGEGVPGLAFLSQADGVVAAWNKGLVPFSRNVGSGSLTVTGSAVRTPEVVSLVGDPQSNRGLVSTRSGWLGAFSIQNGKVRLREAGRLAPFSFLYASPIGRYVIARTTGKKAVVLDWAGRPLDEVSLPEQGMLLVPLD